MQFTLGYICGIGTAGLIFVILAFFRAGIEKRIKIIETKAMNAGPKPKGAIFLPEDDADVARAEHIRKNNARGVDTPLSELQ